MDSTFTDPARIDEDRWPRPGARFGALVIEADRLLYPAFPEHKRFPKGKEAPK